MRLRWVALVGAIASLSGFILVFLPIIQNPILWGVPTTAPAPAYVGFGFVLSIAGLVILIYTMIAFTWQSRNARPSRGAITMAVYKVSYKPAIAGALAFLAARAATHAIFPSPPSSIKLGPILDTGTVVLSVTVSYSVAYYLIRYYDRIPFGSPLVKSVALSTLALLILGGLSALVVGNSFHYMVYLLYGAVSFTATGIVIGFTYSTMYGAQSPAALVASQAKQKRTWLYYLPVLAVIALIVVYTQYQDSLQPVSFRASNVHFMVENGSIQVIANITNTSRPSMIQVDAAIDGLDAGVCGYGINANQTMVCIFQIIPLLSCSQIPLTTNHNLTLSS